MQATQASFYTARDVEEIEYEEKQQLSPRADHIQEEGDEDDVPFQKRRGGILPSANSIMKIQSSQVSDRSARTTEKRVAPANMKSYDQ